MKKTLWILIALCICSLTACGGWGSTDETMIPDNLRVEDPQISYSGGVFFCSFYLNYYSDSEKVSYVLSDEDGKVAGRPDRVESDGHVVVKVDRMSKFSLEHPLKLTVTVKEGREEVTLDVATDITFTQIEDSDKWEVSYLPEPDFIRH